jgi:predicted nuclease of restriction endonuclease-like (RecB) superfamily
MISSIASNEYANLLKDLIGTKILKAQSEQAWGAKVIDQLSHDLRLEFPEMKGFSVRNLKYMRKFAEEYQDLTFVQEASAQLTWFHIAIEHLETELAKEFKDKIA